MKIKEKWVAWEELIPGSTRGIDFRQVGGLEPGSIPFAGATGFLTEDKAGLSWEDTRNVLEVLAPTKNTFIGKGVVGAGASTGGYNVYLGYETGHDNIGGNQNVLIGYWAGYKNTSGQQNTMVGYYAGQQITTSNMNTCMGTFAGNKISTGTGMNTFVGMNAGSLVTTGYENVAVGKECGDTITDGYRNTFIGAHATGFDSDSVYRIAIGYQASSKEDNLCAIGGATAATSVNVAIFYNRELRFYDDGVNYVGFKAPALIANAIWVLPDADGGAGEAIVTNGAKNLSFAPVGATTFLGLTDTPGAYAGEAGKVVVVNAVPDALEFVDTLVLAGLTIVNAINEFSKDGTLGDNSDSAIPTEKAVKTYCDALPVVDTHDILDGTVHTDSVAAVVTRGSIIYGNATPKWDELVLGGADTFLGSDGADISYRTAAQVLASLSGKATATFSFANQALSHVSDITASIITVSNAGLHILDSGGDHDLIIAPNQDYSADRQLTLTIGDANRTLTLNGNPTLDDWFDQGVKQASSVVFAGLIITDIFSEDHAVDHNLFLGHLAGAGIQAGGQYNIFIGESAGAACTTSDMSVVIGYQAGDAFTTAGLKNVIIGYQAGTAETGDRNVFIGYLAGKTSSNANMSVAIGSQAFETGNAAGTVAIGTNALRLATGAQNTAIGYVAGGSLGIGARNTYIGHQAGILNQAGVRNVAIGKDSLYGNTGSYNCAIGDSTLFGSGVSSYNMAIGYASMYKVTGANYCVAIGTESLRLLTTGDNHVALGHQAGYSIVTNSGCVFIGYQAGYNETNANRLYIANSNTATPLIYGEFDNAFITINGYLNITTMKSGATQVAAGAAAGELWYTVGHATLLDNIVMMGV